MGGSIFMEMATAMMAVLVLTILDETAQIEREISFACFISATHIGTPKRFFFFNLLLNIYYNTFQPIWNLDMCR